MKKYYLILVLFFTTIALIAQTDAISYQAVILNPQTQELPGVNAEGNILPNATINMQFTITNSDGSEVYQETQTTVTDAYGMVNLFIGKGNSTSAQNFNEIDWDGTSKKLKVEIDFKGGNNFVFLSDQDLTFTPYAYHRNIIATGNLDVSGKANFKGNFNIDGVTNLNNDLNVAGVTNLNSTLNVTNGSVTNLSGKLNVDENTVLKKDLSVNGKATISDSLKVEGHTFLANLVVKGGNDIGGGSGANHIALFENTNPSNGNKADGIAIRIHGNASNKLGYKNRFITFYGNGDYVAGRIESYNLLAGDFYESFPIPNFANLINVFDFSKVLEWTEPSLTFKSGKFPKLKKGSWPSIKADLTISGGSWPKLTGGTLPSAKLDPGFINLNFDGFFNPVVASTAKDDISAMMGWGMRNGYPGFMPTSPAKIALASVILAAQQVARDQGVVYGSKGADYAEWLEKENMNEKFVFGEVVGVKGGKISKITEGADQVMSISLAPIVLGNMPDEHKKKNYEKVGFMGQVPVLTVGNVAIGDYIVASGYNDGYAKALALKDLKLQDVKNIIGKAWSSSKGQPISLINVSVGLNTTDWVEIVKKQQNQLDNLELKIKRLESLVNKMSTL